MGREREELDELKARYAVMVEQAPEAIVVFSVEQGRFLEVNAQACRLYGLPREQLLAVGPVEMSPEYQPDGRPSREVAAAYIARAIEGEVPSFEWTHRRAGGDDVLCRVQLVRVPSSSGTLVRGSLVDISAMRESERARERFQAILDETPDVVGLADIDGHVLYINPAGRELLGVAADADLSTIENHSFHAPGSARRLREEAIPAAIEHGVWRGESQLRASDGRLIPVSQVIIAHKNARGEVDCLSTISRDISDRVAAEKLQHKVLHAQKLESLGVLAGGIAHDFNNILVGVLANASLMTHLTEPGDQLHQLAREVWLASERAADLAQQMLSYAGKTQVPRGPVDLAELARDVSELVKASISKGADLRFDFADDVPAIEGESAQLRQVLMNLILNASDALGGGTGTIKVSTGYRKLDPQRMTHNYLASGTQSRRHVVLEVSDDGEGMEPELVERIFDPFFTTKVAGRGLGLAAVIGVVKAHHAAVRVITSPDQGTTVRLWFPPADRAASEVPEPPSRDPRSRAELPLDERPLVLVVDDEAVVRRAVRALLGFHGFDVLEASNGREAEDVFREHCDDIDAVLLDLTMPGESGREVMAHLRALRADVPVILTSGFSDEGDEALADAFVPKPFTADQLADSLRRAIRRALGG